MAADGKAVGFAYDVMLLSELDSSQASVSNRVQGTGMAVGSQQGPPPSWEVFRGWWVVVGGRDGVELLGLACSGCRVIFCFIFFDYNFGQSDVGGGGGRARWCLSVCLAVGKLMMGRCGGEDTRSRETLTQRHCEPWSAHTVKG